jgi:D-alanine-D-alanine ligase
MNQVAVMLLFGGESFEHEVSISSARNVFAALDHTKYKVILTYIDETGKWWLLNNLSDQIDISEAAQLLPVLGTGGFTTVPGNEIIKPAVILPILHGTNGEDGTIQGLAKLLHIPIVGCGVVASAVAMDKVLTKQLMEYKNIKTAPYEVHLLNEVIPDWDELSNQLGDILFIKPANGGSSIGVSKVTNEDELAKAINLAHKYDRKVLIEQAISGRELEVAVLGSNTRIRVSVVGEICPDRDFYDYNSKYDASSHTEVVIPANLSSELSENIRKIASQAFGIVNGQGMARIDFFLADDGMIYLNEINTLPGFTNISMYPKLWQSENISYPELIDILLGDALGK